MVADYTMKESIKSGRCQFDTLINLIRISVFRNITVSLFNVVMLSNLVMIGYYQVRCIVDSKQWEGSGILLRNLWKDFSVLHIDESSV